MCLKSFCELSVSVGVCTGVGRHTCICACLYEPSPLFTEAQGLSNKPELIGLAPRILSAFQALKLHVDHQLPRVFMGSKALNSNLHSELQSKVLYQLSHLPSLKC